MTAFQVAESGDLFEAHEGIGGAAESVFDEEFFVREREWFERSSDSGFCKNGETLNSFYYW
jgi:hypothetical protein